MRAALVALCLFGCSSASAQVAPQRWNPAAPENRQVLPNFSFATVESVLTAIGARFERAGSAARPALTVTFANNRRAALIFSNCEAQGCKALSIQSIWVRPATAAPDRLSQALQRFNQRYAFARALTTSDGRPALHRYLTADYGFVRGNLAVNLLVFAEQADRFAREVMQPLQAR
jgi:hypothetical protein